MEYLTIFGNDFPLVMHQYDAVDSRLQGLLAQKYTIKIELEDMNTRIGMSFNLLKSILTNCENAERERNSLPVQKLKGV